ncbi:MAG TPA: fatty acid desaturase [Pirellulales bacterium]|jgi:fatty acid desaturase
MRAKKLGRTLNDRELAAKIHPLRYINNWTNLLYIAADYAVLITLLVGTIAVCQNRAAWGVPWAALVPIVAISIFLIGACQHRLAGMGHEGAHYILMKNRILNELVSDVFCMIPIFTTTEQYRQIHLGHHEHTNDWNRDPEILNVAETRRMADFPMTPWEVFKNFAMHLLWPPTLLRYTWDMIYVNALGNGVHPYELDDARPRFPGKTVRNFRPATWLGLGYVAVMAIGVGTVGLTGPAWLLAVAPVAFWCAGCAVVWLLPESYFFQSKLKPVYSVRITSMLRLASLTILQTAISVPLYLTGTNYAIYFWLLWVLPLGTSFPYLMLLRDLVQHANADDGKLTNSRVVFCHPFIRWAMFVYGQDAHLTHHLYPAVPHYNLPRLHELLKQENQEYAEHVVECHGLVVRGKPGALTGIEVLRVPTREPLDESADEHSSAESALTV